MKDQYRDETDKDVYAENGDLEGGKCSYNDDYVHWLEKKAARLDKYRFIKKVVFNEFKIPKHFPPLDGFDYLVKTKAGKYLQLSYLGGEWYNDGKIVDRNDLEAFYIKEGNQ